MNRRKRKELFKRTTAYLLTLALVFSLFMGTGVTSYASENEADGLSLTNGSDIISDEGDEISGENDDKEEGTGEEPEEETGKTPEEETGENPEEGTGKTPEEGTGEEPEEETGKTPEEETGENPEEETGEEVEADTEEENLLLIDENTPELVNTEGYTGEVQDNGDLFIQSSEMESFDEESIKTLLESHGDEKFPNIFVWSSGTERTIDAGIYNQLIPYLDASSDNCRIYYRFPSDPDTSWVFENPNEISSDLDGTVNLSAEDEITISVPAAASFAGSAADITIILGRSNSTDVGSAMEAVLGTEYLHCYLWTADSDTEISDAWADWNPGSDGYHNLLISNVFNLESGKEYIVAPKAYKGYTWEYNGESYLSISEAEMGDSFNGDAVAALLSAYYSDKKFHSISINAVDKEDKVINAGVYNAVVPYLLEDYESRRIDYSFSGGSESSYWTFDKPAEIEQDISAGVTVAVSDDDRVTVTYNAAAAFKAAAENVSMNYMISPGSEYYDSLRAVLGVDTISDLRLFSVETDEIVEEAGAYWGIYYGVEETGQFLNIYGIQELSDGQSYYVDRYIYRGDVWENEDGTSEIYISAFGLHENGKFLTGELQSIVDWYKQQGQVFDIVNIEEAYGTANIIKKDYINLAREILSTDENSDQKVTFVFNRSEAEKCNELRWNLYSPGEASKDINANVTLTVLDYGAEFKVNTANTYNVRTASVTFRVSPELELGSKIREVFSGAEDIRLDVLKGGTALADDIHGGYWTDDDAVNLDVSCVQKCVAKTGYVVVKAGEIEACYNVGEEVTLEKDSRITLSAVPDGAVTWKSYSANIVTIAGGVMSVLNPGEAYISASYQSGGRTCLDVFHIYTENRVTKILFDRSALTMELWEEEGEYTQDCRDYLSIKVYPSEAGCDQSNPDEVIWSTSNSAVVELVSDENGNYYGEIRAVGPGTATITASYVRDYNEDNSRQVLTAECQVTVLAPLTINDEDWPDYDGRLYAITNFDTKLSDVELPEGWEWSAPNTSLTPFKDAEGHAFAAKYTAEDAGGNAKTETHNLWVRMVTITGISIVAVEPDETYGWRVCALPSSITGDEAVSLDYIANIKNGGIEDIIEEWEERMVPVWTSSPKNIGSQEASRYDFALNDTNVDGRKAGKKTFTLTVKDTKTNKVFAKASYSLNVTNNAVLNFDEDVRFEREISEGGGSDKLVIKVCKEKYDLLGKNKLTIKSGDTSILKLGSSVVLTETVTETDDNNENIEYVVIEVPYTQKSFGDVYVTITAADEMKSSTSYLVRFTDSVPKLLTPAVTINKALSDTAVPLEIAFEEEYPVVLSAMSDNLSIVGNDKFELRYAYDTEDNTYAILKDVTLSVKEGASISKGTYKVTIQIPVRSDDEEKEYENKTITVTVKVVDSVPSVAFKQTRKVNTFYTDEEGNGLLNVTVKNAEIESLQLTGCDYELGEPDEAAPNLYPVVLGEGKAGKVKKGTLTYTLKGYTGTYTKTITIGTAVTKPVIVLSAKTDTLYPEVGYGASCLQLTNKATGEAIRISEANYIAGKNSYEELPEGEASAENIKVKYNTFKMYHEGENGCLVFALADDTASVAKTDSITIQVKESNWSQYINVSYKIKVDKTVKPKLKLGSSTITLNKNDDVFKGQQIKTSLSLSGCSNILDQDDVYVTFMGTDVKSNKVLKVNGSLVLQYWREQGCIVAKFNDNELAAGTYKYNITVGNDFFEATVPLTIKVVDKAVKDCISVSAKGSIDLLMREDTSIAYTPKLKNITGYADGGWLSGQDANLFDSYFEDGKLYVKARIGETYSTANTYKVKAVFWVQTEDYLGYELESKELSIKLKQGKPKVSVSSGGNTLYRSLENAVEVNISALLSSQDVVIEEVSLLNYTDDLCLVEDFYNANTGDDAETDPWWRAYNPDSKSVLLTTTGEAKSILKSGKTWSVKLAVHYRDQAGNVKDTQVTYKVVVK